jgi:hypothetical protein
VRLETVGDRSARCGGRAALSNGVHAPRKSFFAATTEAQKVATTRTAARRIVAGWSVAPSLKKDRGALAFATVTRLPLRAARSLSARSSEQGQGVLPLLRGQLAGAVCRQFADVEFRGRFGTISKEAHEAY